MIRRITGVLLMCACLLTYRPQSDGVVNDLILPLAAGCAAWLVIDNLTAIAIAAFCLALIYSDLNAGWIEAWAYPSIAFAAGASVMVVFARRATERIRATREARWAARRPGGNDSS